MSLEKVKTFVPFTFNGKPCLVLDPDITGTSSMIDRLIDKEDLEEYLEMFYDLFDKEDYYFTLDSIEAVKCVKSVRVYLNAELGSWKDRNEGFCRTWFSRSKNNYSRNHKIGKVKRTKVDWKLYEEELEEEEY